MEGPSLYLAAEQLAHFVNKKIERVDGNTKIGKERLNDQKILAIFSWGKHLVFQFETFALRVHFMLFGSFEATVKGKKVTGDYPKKNRTPRLVLQFKNGSLEMYSCSLKFIESSDAKKLYDFSIDTMSDAWDEKKALKNTLKHSESEIADVLLDQEIFAGVGNIIKNEVLFLERISPEIAVKDIPQKKLKQLIKKIREFVFQFYEWRKAFILRKHFQIYKKRVCSICQNAVLRKKTGKRQRISYVCSNCQI